MTHGKFVAAFTLIAIHTALNLWLLEVEAPDNRWIGAQSILTTLTLFVIVRAYSDGVRS